MSGNKRLKEPKIDWLFRKLFKEKSRLVEERRFIGLRHRPGLVPPEPITLDTKAQYYTNRETRSLETISISDLEAKSASDDRYAKYFGTFLFISIFALSLLSGRFDEMRALYLDFSGAENINLDTWPRTTLGLWAVVTLCFLAGMFVWMTFVFSDLSRLWESNIDSFFASTARAQMEAVRDCMRVFKRFLKWRRYMRLMMVSASAILIVEVYLLLAASGLLGPNAVGSEWSVWSGTEVMFAGWFLFLQFTWFVGYWYILVYYTTYRDPTLQMCIMVNFLDRARVATVNVGGGSH